MHKINHVVNQTKNENRHYKPVLLGNMNVRLGKAKFHSLRIILDSKESFLIVLGKHKKNYLTKIPSWSNVAPKAVTF